MIMWIKVDLQEARNEFRLMSLYQRFETHHSGSERNGRLAHAGICHRHFSRSVWCIGWYAPVIADWKGQPGRKSHAGARGC